METAGILQNLFEFFTDPQVLIRLFLLVLTIMYGLYAIVVAFQIRTLNNTVTQVTFSQIFTFLGFLHAGLALALMLSVIMIL